MSVSSRVRVDFDPPFISFNANNLVRVIISTIIIVFFFLVIFYLDDLATFVLSIVICIGLVIFIAFELQNYKLLGIKPLDGKRNGSCRSILQSLGLRLNLNHLSIEGRVEDRRMVTCKLLMY